jgi:transposase
MQIVHARKMRIYPNNTQKQTINQTLGHCRYVYNKMLERNQKVYKRRCFPRERSDIKDILKSCHLKEYDPEALVRYFKGRFAADHCWIDFIEEK